MKTIILIILFFGVGQVSAQSANNAIKKLQNKFNSINNFTADFSQNIFSLKGTGQGRGSGKFSYKKKNKFIVELKNQSIISDGVNIWNYDKKFNRVVISYLEDDPTSFSLEKFIFDYPSLCRTKLVKDNPVHVGEELIVLTPKDNDLQFKEVRIWKSSDDLISRMELVDLGDMKYAFSFTELKPNQDLSDQNFTFNPPKGIKVIDLR
jgi:outer membrane lipoprotein carrier protein